MGDSVATDVQILTGFALVGVHSRSKAVVQEVVVELSVTDDVKRSCYPTFTSVYELSFRKPVNSGAYSKSPS